MDRVTPLQRVAPRAAPEKKPEGLEHHRSTGFSRTLCRRFPRLRFFLMPPHVFATARFRDESIRSFRIRLT